MLLHRFLETTKHNLKFCATQGGKIVLGNESCDLDSAISAIVYSYSLHNLKIRNDYLPLLPVLNIKRSEFSLKTEVQYWLSKFEITVDHLIFRDDFNWIEVSKMEDVDLCLVDHNVLPFHDRHLEPLVAHVIDHHKLERTDTPVHGMIVEPVGSCCTLVAEQIFNKTPEIISEDIGKLLYGTILLDTINLNETAKRATPKDIDIIEKLEEQFSIPKENRSKIYQELIEAKTDISSLSAEQILQKDRKVINDRNLTIAFSSVPLLAEVFQEREDIEKSIKETTDFEKFGILIVMGIDATGSVKRDLLIYSSISTILEQLSSYLEEAEDGVLQLEGRKSEIPNSRLYFQRNVTASRKKVLPLVQTWLTTRE